MLFDIFLNNLFLFLMKASLHKHENTQNTIQQLTLIMSRKNLQNSFTTLSFNNMKIKPLDSVELLIVTIHDKLTFHKQTLQIRQLKIKRIISIVKFQAKMVLILISMFIQTLTSAHSCGISGKHIHYKKLKILKNRLTNSCMILKVGSLNFFKME